VCDGGKEVRVRKLRYQLLALVDDEVVDDDEADDDDVNDDVRDDWLELEGNYGG